MVQNHVTRLLPKMSGYELMKKVQNLYPNIPIQLASGFSEEEDIELDYTVLRKPYGMTELLTRVCALLIANSKNKREILPSIVPIALSYDDLYLFFESSRNFNF